MPYMLLLLILVLHMLAGGLLRTRVHRGQGILPWGRLETALEAENTAPLEEAVVLKDGVTAPRNNQTALGAGRGALEVHATALWEEDTALGEEATALWEDKPEVMPKQTALGKDLRAPDRLMFQMCKICITKQGMTIHMVRLQVMTTSVMQAPRTRTRMVTSCHMVASCTE